MPDSGKTILIIDDEAALRDTLSDYLEDRGYRVLAASDGKAGLELFAGEDPDLVLTDLIMPGTGGLDVLRWVGELSPETPTVVVSGTGDIRDSVEALRLGAWDYLSKPIGDMAVVSHAVSKNLERARLRRETRLYREHLEELVASRTEELERKTAMLEVSRRRIMAILSVAAEYRDFETGMHVLRVAGIAVEVARELGMPEECVRCIELTAPLHDIGKIGIPDRILLKPGPLDPEEWEEMQRHCWYGKEILERGSNHQGFKLDQLQTDPPDTCDLVVAAACIALNHHEWWNGEGYPAGIAGTEIPLEARITAIADVYDAVQSPRPYKSPWSEERALELIGERRGTQFDPRVVDAFLARLGNIGRLRRRYRD